jgi:uncharacterized membrane protein YfcA
MEYLLLVATGLAAGMVNSIAGGGIFLIMPALIMAGLTGKQSNASGSFAVWVGQVISLRENRDFLPKKTALIRQIIGLGLGGSIAGAFLLLFTPNVNFERALPFLNAAATLIFVVGPWLRNRRSRKQASPYAFPLFLLAAGIYGGYFGGGLGMLMLAVLSMSTLQDVKQQNAVKLLTASVINSTALVILVFGQLVIWRYALPAAAGAFAGGLIGARFSKHVSARMIRYLVVGIGAATTLYLFLRFY